MVSIDKACSLDGLIAQMGLPAASEGATFLKKAYYFSEKAHAGQRRQSGEPYIDHPLAVAHILTRFRLDIPSIAAALLHDVIEDTHCTLETIRQEFGEDVMTLVDGVSKIGRFGFKNSQEQQTENFRKMVFAIASDIRVLLIKLADRLHNMRTLDALSEERQKRIARETLDIYAPLANRLGIGWLRSELEDHCLRFLKPQVYQMLSAQTTTPQGDQNRYIKEVVASIESVLSEHELTGKVTGRQKHLFGVYQKMERQGIPLEEVYDKVGVRVIVGTKADCYALLGIIHSLWFPVPGRFKDYIAIPKSNQYQSLHTTVVGPGGQHIELQIRTEQMHRIAEEGIAAHWIYKEGGQINVRDEHIKTRIRQFKEWQNDFADTHHILDYVKTDLFADVIYVFTPKGSIKELPKGSTPVDFAYAVHTEIGHRCVGAKINGKIVPLRHLLKSGDTVDILTSSVHSPSRDWLKFVKTSRAKAKIRHFIQEKERGVHLEIGKKILTQEIRRANLGTDILRSDKLIAGVSDRGIRSLDELFIAIGYGKISAIRAIRPLLPEPSSKDVGGNETGTAIDRKTTLSKSALPIGNVIQAGEIGTMMTRLSKCCHPIPGDVIIGFISRGRGLAIHTADCPNLDALHQDPNRFVNVEWTKDDGTGHESRYRANIRLLTLDKPGILAAVSTAIAKDGTNIKSAKIVTTDNDKATFQLAIEVSGSHTLRHVIENIKQIDGVLQVERIRKTLPGVRKD